MDEVIVKLLVTLQEMRDLFREQSAVLAQIRDTQQDSKPVPSTRSD